MADQRSIEMLAFNFASRTFAYKRLAQGLSRALSAFSSFMREYLDKVIKADQCAQYVDDIGIAANSVTQLIRNIRAVFECIRRAGLKLTIEKCHFGVTEVEFLGRTITPQGIAPQDHKIQKFLANVRFPKSKKQVQRYIGFVNYYRNYIPRLSEKLLGFYELLKADKQIKVTEELLDHYKAINAALAQACGLALKQPITGRQYVLMTDASFRASGYALYPQPPFKIECANAQLEQPIATADIQFNIGTYTFTDTFVILSKTSFPIIGLNFMRNHQAVIDTANGTINFPHVEMTLAMTDEMKNATRNRSK